MTVCQKTSSLSNSKKVQILYDCFLGATVVDWLSSRLTEQEVRVRFPVSPLEFSQIGYDLLLPSRDMAEMPLKGRKSSIQPTNQSI